MSRVKCNTSKTAMPCWLLGALVFLLILSGCSLPDLKYQRSIRLKEKETTDLIRYMEKHKIDTARAFYLDEEGSVEVLNKGIAVPASMEIMDNAGRVYTLYDSLICSGRTKAFIADELNENLLKPSKDNTLYSILSSSLFNFKDEKSESFDSLLEKSKYTVVIFWATYGKRNKNINEWQTTISRNANYQFITVNLDVNTTWVQKETATQTE